MKPSSLSDQVVYRKKGRIVSPLVDELEDVLKLNSWSLERVPEYLWLALILDKYGRTQGLQYCSDIIRFITKNFPEINSAKISDILHADTAVQIKIFEKINTLIDPKVLSPLTVVIDNSMSKTFYNQFYIAAYSMGDRAEKLKEVTKKYNSPDSFEATDVRYLAVLPKVFFGNLTFTEDGLDITAMKNYSTTTHDEEIMALYRPVVRTIEGVQMPDDKIDDFVSLFWKRVMAVTDCKPMAISFKKETNKQKYFKFIENTKEAINYLNVKSKEKTLLDDAYSVLIGSLAYAFKTFIEVIEHDLGNTIIGRQSIRIIIEIYIMMKYLCLKEAEKPEIWKEYKAYGIGKYKLILLKVRAGMGNDISHITEPLLNAIVNEPMLEEFTDIDLKYFDDIKIRDKAMSIGEKDLYDVAYDYDSSYAHGLWGAVRESSMLSCGNVFHHYHAIPDATATQNLSDVTEDCYKYLVKLIKFVNQKYNLSKWYMEYLEEVHDE
ncbi:MAG: DUF5677 domain-containing protein [Eubacterium sp.]